MRVTVHPADEGGCGYYRLNWPGEALAAQGHDVRVETDYTYKRAQWMQTMQGEKMVGFDQQIDADVIVIQRPLSRTRLEMIRAFQAEGVAVVVEIDDDFHSLHKKHPAWPIFNPLTGEDPDRNRDWLMRACREADLVTVTTPALAARYAEHGRYAVIPNYVPEWYTRLTVGAYTKNHLPDLKGTNVGWSGSAVTHPGDLPVVGDGIQRALTQTGAGFHIIGTGLGVSGKIPSPAHQMSLTSPPSVSGWVPLQAYPEAIKQLDIGIVPLGLTAFNEAKSALKGMEYAAVGVPFVASPTGPYLKLAEDGIGWIAKTPDDWHALVAELVNDPVHREALSIAWRDEIAAHYTIEKNTGQWWQAWGQALENSKRREAA